MFDDDPTLSDWETGVDRSWIEQLLTRRAGPDDVNEALAQRPDNIKVVMEVASA